MSLFKTKPTPAIGLLLILSLTAMILTGCTKKSDEAATPAYTKDAALIGTWVNKADTVKFTADKYSASWFGIKNYWYDYGCTPGQVHCIAPNGSENGRYEYSVTGKTLSFAEWRKDSYGKYQSALTAVLYQKIK